MNKEQTEKLEILERLIKLRIPSSRAHVEEDSYEMMLKLIDEIKNARDYRQMAVSFVGTYINDFFCNGFFGSDTYDLEGAEILRVYEEYDEYDSGDGTIILEVRKLNDIVDYAYFSDGWNDWETVYKHLDEWVNGVEHY